MSKYCDICPNGDSDGISVYCNVKHGMVSPDGSCPDYGMFFKSGNATIHTTTAEATSAVRKTKITRHIGKD